MSGADLLRGAEPFVGEGGRHADVDHGDVGRLGCDQPDELLGGGGLGEHVDALVGQQSREALADDDGVVGEDHPHGIAAVIRVPPPEGAVDPQATVERLDSVAEAAEPGAGGVGAADAVVGDLDRHAAVRAHDVESDARGIRVLDDVGERLGGDEVHRCLDGVGQTLGTDGQLDRHLRTPRERGEGGGEAFVGEDRRVDAARERAQLGEGVDDLGVRLGEELVDRRRAAVGEPAAGELEGEPDSEQALLCAVVDVALEAPPLGVAGLDDPRAGGAHLGELGAQLGLQARVLEREARCCADGLDELGLVEERRVVNQSREALSVVLEHGHRPPGLAFQVERVSVGVDVAPVLREPEGELERRVAERSRDRVADLRGRRQRSKLDDQLGHGRAVQSRAQKAGEERERDRSKRNGAHPGEAGPRADHRT